MDLIPISYTICFISTRTTLACVKIFYQSCSKAQERGDPHVSNVNQCSNNVLPLILLLLPVPVFFFSFEAAPERIFGYHLRRYTSRKFLERNV